YIAAVVAICMQFWNLPKNSDAFTNYFSTPFGAESLGSWLYQAALHNASHLAVDY
ncbi:hypothetical protein JOM56_000471, partial [Amanita muscaria]